MDERVRFVLEQQRDLQTMTELCEIYGIARETGYYWLRRYQQGGLEALHDLNRAPRRHPNQTAEKIEEAVLQLRRAHMSWGPRKLKRVLERDRPLQLWPATSTIGAMLAREGLVVARKKRRRAPPYTEPFAAADAPNRVWCADFKGWFLTADGERIDPLTITDACSRYLLRCQSVEKMDYARVRAIFESAFRECGLPSAIRTDNGAPFASRAVAGLSRLAVWWMKLGIVPERIAAGHPEQNGRHERMHRTLKQETAAPPAGAATGVRSFSVGVQRRASARSVGNGNTWHGVRAIVARVSGASAGAGIQQRLRSATGAGTRRFFLEASARIFE
jgi:putative transposase